MAIYHLNTRTFSRSRGQSASSKRDYVTREGRYQEGALEVLYKESGNLPSFARDGKDFWTGVDLFERANARLGREVEVALPRELSDEGKILLARRLRHAVVGNKHPYTLAIHKGSGRDNPHLHLIFSTRSLDGVERTKQDFFKRANPDRPEQGGASKSRDFMKKAWLTGLRRTWSELANDALAREGRRERIDERSLSDQGFTRTPQQHLGPKVVAMERRGVRTERATELIRDMDTVEAQRRSLTRQLEEVERELRKHTARTQGAELGRA